VDFNQLLYHHQIALMAVSQAQRDGQTLPNFDLPGYYAKRINAYREQRGLSDSLVPPEPLQQAPLGDSGTLDADGAYPAFVGDTLIAELLINKTLSMTPAEREGYALTGIVARLAALQEDLWAIGRDIYQALELDEDKLAQLAADWAPSPEPKGREAADPGPNGSRPEEGITHAPGESFRFGSFVYADSKDAADAVLGGQANDV